MKLYVQVNSHIALRQNRESAAESTARAESSRRETMRCSRTLSEFRRDPVFRQINDLRTVNDVGIGKIGAVFEASSLSQKMSRLSLSRFVNSKVADETRSMNPISNLRPRAREFADGQKSSSSHDTKHSKHGDRSNRLHRRNAPQRID